MQASHPALNVSAGVALGFSRSHFSIFSFIYILYLDFSDKSRPTYHKQSDWDNFHYKLKVHHLLRFVRFLLNPVSVFPRGATNLCGHQKENLVSPDRLELPTSWDYGYAGYPWSPAKYHQVLYQLSYREVSRLRKNLILRRLISASMAYVMD